MPLSEAVRENVKALNEAISVEVGGLNHKLMLSVGLVLMDAAHNPDDGGLDPVRAVEMLKRLKAAAKVNAEALVGLLT